MVTTVAAGNGPTAVQPAALVDYLAEAIEELGLGRVKVPDGRYRDTILVPLAGPWLKISRAPDRPGIPIRVDLNVLYHLYCSDPATVRACCALRAADRKNDVDFTALLDVFGMDWCPDNEHLQVQGIHSFREAAAIAYRMAEAAVVFQAVAYSLGEWEPNQ